MEKNRPVVPTYCYFQGCYNPVYEREIERGKDLCFRFNALHPCDREGQTAILRELLGKMGDGAVFTPPFWCDYGYNIEVGRSFYANHNLVITDGAKVTFGDNVFIAPNCCFTTAEHPTDPDLRRDGVEMAKPITVGDNVWIGAGFGEEIFIDGDQGARFRFRRRSRTAHAESRAVAALTGGAESGEADKILVCQPRVVHQAVDAFVEIRVCSRLRA